MSLTHLAKIVEQAALMQEVHAGMAAQTTGVIMIAVDGEDGQGHVHVGVLLEENIIPESDKYNKRNGPYFKNYLNFVSL